MKTTYLVFFIYTVSNFARRSISSGGFSGGSPPKKARQGKSGCGGSLKRGQYPEFFFLQGADLFVAGNQCSSTLFMYGSRGCPAPIIDRDCDILDQNVVTRMIKVDDTFKFTPVVK